MKKHVVILSGWDNEALTENPRLVHEVEAFGHKATVVDYQTTSLLEVGDNAVELLLEDGTRQTVHADVVIPRVNEPDLESFERATRFLAAFSELGVPLTASIEAIDACKNKQKTHDLLAANGVATPRTAVPISNELSHLNQILEFVEPDPEKPVIVKNNRGTQGIGVAILFGRMSALSTLQLINNEIPVLVQECIETRTPEGLYRDYRLNLVGGHVVASMERQSTDFRANLSLNDSSGQHIIEAHGYPWDPPDVVRDLAERAAQAIGCGNVGIDVLRSEANDIEVVQPNALRDYVSDINISAGFRGIEAVMQQHHPQRRINLPRSLVLHALSL